MRTNREKTTSIAGFVVSILLHGIFFAGCFALDYGNMNSSPAEDATEINHITEGDVAEKSKS